MSRNWLTTGLYSAYCRWRESLWQGFCGDPENEDGRDEWECKESVLKKSVSYSGRFQIILENPGRGNKLLIEVN